MGNNSELRPTYSCCGFCWKPRGTGRAQVHFGQCCPNSCSKFPNKNPNYPGCC